MVRNKLHWDANGAVGLPKQRNSYHSSPTFLCFESPTASFASQCNLFRAMWPDRAKGLLTSSKLIQLSCFWTGSGWRSTTSSDEHRNRLESAVSWTWGQCTTCIRPAIRKFAREGTVVLTWIHERRRNRSKSKKHYEALYWEATLNRAGRHGKGYYIIHKSEALHTYIISNLKWTRTSEKDPRRELFMPVQY